MATLAMFRCRRSARCRYRLLQSASQRAAACAASTSKKRNRELPCLVTFVEGDVRWWDEAVQHVEELTSGLPEAERRKWQLLVAVYRERAQAHTELVGSVRKRSGG
jgi:hypothetical protein